MFVVNICSYICVCNTNTPTHPGIVIGDDEVRVAKRAPRMDVNGAMFSY